MPGSKSRVRREALAALATLAALAACRPSGSSKEAPADPSAAPSLPSEVQTAPSVCTLRTDHFRPLGEVELSTSGTAPPFATLGTRGVLGPRVVPLHAELGISSDDAMPFSLRLIGLSVDVRVQVPRTSTIHAAGPLALGAFAGALPSTELRVVRANGLEIEVEADPGPAVTVVGPALRARGQCSRFAIERRDFIASAVVPGVKWKEEPDALLKKGAPIPLTTLPIGEPVARLEPRPTDSAGIVVFEREKATERSHVGWFSEHVLVHGWIPTSALLPLARQAAPEGTMSAPRPEPPPARERLACDAAVPLVAQIGTSRATIGTIVARAAFDVLAREKGWAEVRVDVPLLSLASGARLLVREADLTPCRTPSPAPSASPR